jgi:hypothetical protein
MTPTSTTIIWDGIETSGEETEAAHDPDKVNDDEIEVERSGEKTEAVDVFISRNENQANDQG